MMYRKPWSMTAPAILLLVIVVAGFFGWAIALIASIKA